MPVTRSEKRQGASSELSDPPSSNLSQTSELELSNSISRSKRSKKLPSGSEATPSNNTTVTTGPKSDTSFITPQDEPRVRSLRSRSYMTSSNKTDVAHAQELELSKSLSRSEKRSEHRRLKKLESRSEVPSSKNSTVASALKSGLSPYTPQVPRIKSLRSRSYLSLSMNNTPTPAQNLDMRSYCSQEMGSKKINLRSYESSVSQFEFSDTMEIMSSRYEEAGVKNHRSDSNMSSSKKGNRAPNPVSNIRSTSPQKDSQRPNKKPRLLMKATLNDAQTPESSAKDTTPRLKLYLKKPDSGATLPTGNSAPSSEGISTPFSQGTPVPVSRDLSSPLSEELSPLSEDLSSPLSERKSTPSSEGKSARSSGGKGSSLSASNSASYSEHSVASLSKPNPTVYSETIVTPLPSSSFAPLSESNYAPSPKPQSRKRAAPHSETSTDGIYSTPNSKLRKLSSNAGSDDTILAEELSPEKQSQYIAEREKEPQRVADQQKLLATMEQFKKGFKDLLSHIRAPRKNSHNKKNFNEHMFVLKLSPQFCLMAPSQRHVGIYMKDACFDLASQAMTIWVTGLLMEVIKSDGLAWGEVAIEPTEGGSLGKVSNWGFNAGCLHKLETCFINTNVEILFCKKTFSAIITYHHQWKCSGQYEVPSGDMTDVSRTDRTTTGGGRLIQSGTGEYGYGMGSHTPLAGPLFSHVAAPVFPPVADYPEANPYPANPYLPLTTAPAPLPLQSVFGDYSAYYPDLALPIPTLYEHHHHQFGFPVDTPLHYHESDPLSAPYQWTPAPQPTYLSSWTSVDSLSPAQQFTYPDPDIATESYVANWVAASLNLPGSGELYDVNPPPVPAPAPAPELPSTGPKKRARKSRAKMRVAAEPVPIPMAAMTMMETEMMAAAAPAPALEPAVFGPSPSETLAALQSMAAAAPGVPVPAAYRHVWFLNGRGRVSKTRDNNPRCRRCRRRHWASCSRGQPCDECAKDGVACVYGPGVGVEEVEKKGH